MKGFIKISIIDGCVSLQNNQNDKSKKSCTFFVVFSDFFKSYESKPLTFKMFFVVLWEVVSILRAIFDNMTQNRENRKKRVL